MQIKYSSRLTLWKGANYPIVKRSVNSTIEEQNEIKTGVFDFVIAALASRFIPTASNVKSM